MKKYKMSELTRQRLIGMFLIVVGLATMIIASTSNVPEDMDAGISLFAIPLGAWLFLTKKKVMKGR